MLLTNMNKGHFLLQQNSITLMRNHFIRQLLKQAILT
jgi:hypothetical protein